MKKYLGLMILALACYTTQLFAAVDPQNSAKLASGCAACHGADGNSLISTNPRLAGQNQKYFIAQMHAFAQGQNGKRFNPIMLGFAKALTTEQIEDLADFYAKQSLKQNTATSQNLAIGQRIYQGGIREQALPACSACHGPNGIGNPEAGFPALSGQYASYIVTQLSAFKNGTRKTDLNGMMQQIAQKLTTEQMQAVGNYIQGLH